MTSPVPNAQRRLHRVIAIARADSTLVLVFAGGSAILSALQSNWVFAIFSVLAMVAGGMERHGAELLDGADPRGLEWLPGAQGVMFTVIAGYAAWRWRYFDPAAYWAEIPTVAQERIVEQMKTGGLDPDNDRVPLLRIMNGLVCGTMLVVSFFYQGGLALWYRLQRNAVHAGLENPSTPPELPR